MIRKLIRFGTVATLLVAMALPAGAATRKKSRRSDPAPDPAPAAVTPELDPSGKTPRTRAESVLVSDALTGQVLYEKNADEQRPPASTQKLLTALVIVESGNLNQKLRVDLSDTQVEPVKLDSGYHIPGKLEIVDAKLVKELFDTAMPVLRAARGAEVLIVGPLQRYLQQLCCLDNSHITNFEDSDYATSIAGAIKEVGIHLRNLLHTRRLKGVKLLNPAVLMGMTAGNAADSSITTSYWGRDPVHPLDIAYTNMAKKILEEVNEEAVVNARRPASQQAATDRPTAARRER